MCKKYSSDPDAPISGNHAVDWDHSERGMHVYSKLDTPVPQEDIDLAVSLLKERAPLVRELRYASRFEEFVPTTEADLDCFLVRFLRSSYCPFLPQHIKQWHHARQNVFALGSEGLLDVAGTLEVADFLVDSAHCLNMERAFARLVSRLVATTSWGTTLGKRTSATLASMHERFICGILANVRPFGRLITSAPQQLLELAILSRMARGRLDLVGETMSPEATCKLTDGLQGSQDLAAELISLDVSATRLDDYSATRIFALVFRTPTAQRPRVPLLDLNLSCNSFSSAAPRQLRSTLRTLAQARRAHPDAPALPLQRLQLQGNELGAEGGRHLADALVCFPDLRLLNISSCFIPPAAMLEIVRAALQHTPRLSSFYADCNPLGSGAMPLDAIQNLALLGERNWVYEGVTQETSQTAAAQTPAPDTRGGEHAQQPGAIAAERDCQQSAPDAGPGVQLATEFGHLITREHMCEAGLSQLQFRPAECTAALRVVAESEQPLPLQSLDISHSCTVPEAASTLEEMDNMADVMSMAFSKMPQLRHLNLSGVCASYQMLAKLTAVSALATLEHLTVLALSHMRMRDAGAQLVASVVRYLPRLEMLDVRHNRLTETGVRALLTAFAGHPRVQRVVLAGNSELGPRHLRALDKELRLPNLQLIPGQMCFVSAALVRGLNTGAESVWTQTEPSYHSEAIPCV